MERGSGRGRGREGRDGFVEKRAEEEEEGSAAVESEVRVRATERRREKKLLKYLYKCYSNRAYIHGYCSNTVAIVHKCTILPPLMWVFFWPKCVKGVTFSILLNFPQADVVALRIGIFELIVIN